MFINLISTSKQSLTSYAVETSVLSFICFFLFAPYEPIDFSRLQMFQYELVIDSANNEANTE